MACDSQHLYFWQESGAQPIMQFQIPQHIEDASFLSSDPGSPIAIVDSHGDIEIAGPDGSRKRHYTSNAQPNMGGARIWVDPDDQGSWYAVVLTPDWALSSGLHDIPTSTRTSNDLWNVPIFQAESHNPWLQNPLPEMALGTLTGLPCLVVTRKAHWGAGVCFLDPKTLVSLRRPLVIRESVGEVAIAAGRWLLAALLKNNSEPKNRLMVWDLDSEAGDPIGGWFEEIDNVYHLIVTTEKADSFQTVQVFHTFELPPHENPFQMVCFDWPSGEITQIQKFKYLKIWPVESSLDRQ
jgi:hypothetical protein